MQKGFLVELPSRNKKEKQNSRINNDNNNAIDRISFFPKAMLHHILTFLDIREVVRTSVLSKKWRDVWACHHTIDIDDQLWLQNDGEFNVTKFSEFVNKLLLQRDDSSIQTFRLSRKYVNVFVEDDYMGNTCTWVTSAVRRNLQNLFLEVVHMPPLLSFSSATTLKTLHLKGATLPVQVEGSWLGPALENLIIENCRHDYLENINICSKQLKYLTVKNTSKDHSCAPGCCELKISAPNLTSLECIGYMFKNYSLENLSSVVTAHIDTKSYNLKKMNVMLATCLNKILRGLATAKSLTLAVDSIQRFAELPNLLNPGPISFPNLKYLKLKEWRSNGYIHHLAKLFECFSSIETLVVERTTELYKAKKINYDKQLVLNCTFNNLKSVVIKDIKGLKNELSFIKSILKNAIVLEKITITTVDTRDRENLLAEFNKKLQSLPRASSSANIVFITKGGS